MKTTMFLSVLLVLVGFQGCSLFGRGDEETFKIDEKATKLVEVNNQFGFELFQRVYSFEEEAENIMVSPLSVALALAMTYNGAEGETKSAMEVTLRLSGLTTDEINRSYQTLVESLKSLDSKVLLEIANAIFYRSGFEVENQFVTSNTTYYDAEISALDFSQSSALETINDWVNQKTHTKIPTIIDRISPNHVMFLLNAIYFKGTWTREFNKENTTRKVFKQGNNQQTEVDMMHSQDTVAYLKGDQFSAIRLPYGKENYNMYVVLPDEIDGLNNLIDNLNPGNWAQWMKGMTEKRPVEIFLPKLKFPYEIKLNDVLTDMGMGIAFTGSADFSGINKNGGLCIDYVKHKSFIEVNEEGTEAAAVTIVAIERTSATDDKVYFNANHPFLFVITEKTTGAILFIGTVKNPAAS